MPTYEERLAYLEGRVEEQTRATDGIREALGSLERRMDARFEAADRRFEGLERRLEGFEQRVDRRFEGLDHQLDGIDGKMTRFFVWVVGIQVTMLVAGLTAFATIITR